MSTMKFCRRCNNVLYPKEDKEQKLLLYACRNCNHEEIADNNIVYRNKIHHSVQRRTRELENVAADPTLPRTKSVRCSQCNHGEAVFFQAPVKGEEGMALIFVCCNPSCGNRWRD
ncbi:DNA-directed RNA polymerases II, IV and V subunit 9A [Cajanus cajan]|uniref:DNA-directed RNA polymerase subunit n=1 Tax=Cajanus cajan TaxID=3821 RepID=A0A151SSZ2_CAJCA|nr:DNA-directed RNA polymerases II, IV and V subunit 9A [Cajanus cajan]KYP57896.1 DNA-directed RNA polymerase II subunit RPB9 [Cajanus cajan]